jgi:3-dehydroquinate dehydratase type I
MVEVRFDRLYLIRPETVVKVDDEGETQQLTPLPESEWECRPVSEIKAQSVIGELRGGIPLPVIFTCRATSEGGFFPGDEEQRCAILSEAISSGVSYIDLEIAIDDSIRSELMASASESAVKVVASIHEEGVPSVNQIVEQVKEDSQKGDILKMCWTTESMQESLQMVEASWTLKGDGHTFALMGLGPGGDWTRLHAPVLEQSLVYATLLNDFHLGDRGLVNVRDLRDAWSLLEY